MTCSEDRVLAPWRTDGSSETWGPRDVHPRRAHVPANGTASGAKPPAQGLRVVARDAVVRRGTGQAGSALASWGAARAGHAPGSQRVPFFNYRTCSSRSHYECLSFA